MYVDDIMGFSLTKNGNSERMIARDICIKLFGPNSVEDSKTIYTTNDNPCVDMIGYKLNLQTEVVSISRRNML